MAARTIVTSHPDVECDVCGRRLLRGERPDVFLGGGQRRMVCELCASRATHEGWRREPAGGEAPSARTSRPARGRSLLERLRGRREPVHGGVRTDPETTVAVPAHDGRSHRTARAGGRGEAEWVQIEDEWGGIDQGWNGPQAGAVPAQAGTATPALEPGGSGATAQTSASPQAALQAENGRQAGAAVPADPAASLPPTEALPIAEIPGAARAHESAQAEMRLALDTFNSGAAPQRVAGVARSLGPAIVHMSVRSQGVVAIVVAWELCWYRYEVDLAEQVAAAQIVADGTELHELAPAERVANAAADEHGRLALAAN
jgi:hypothetical protein